MWIILGFSFFKMFIVILPVFVQFLQELGLTMTQVMQSQAIFAMVVAICEIPTGYFADRFGRKLSMQLGSLIYGLAFSLLPFVDSFQLNCVQRPIQSTHSCFVQSLLFRGRLLEERLIYMA